MKWINPTFEKSLALLAHPFSIAAVVLMLVNDQALRRLSPSWWTGKLSDLAWLFFVPFLAAAALAWLVPGRNNPARHETRTFVLSFALTGIAFCLVKTIPAANLVATRIFYTATGAAPSLRLDPADLLALPALGLSFILWRASLLEGFQLPAPRRMARALVLVPLTMLVLMADAAAPDTGISCFSQQGDQIYARGGYGSSFVSKDGGVTWEATTPGTPIECASKNSAMATEWVEAPGPQPGTLYRYIPDQEIQVSTDAGKNWKTGMKFTAMSEAERYYYLKTRMGSPIINPGPLDAFADPKTGNMLFAMGQQGILIHTAQDQWQWRQGGTYQRPAEFPSAEALTTLLGGMVFLALAAALLIYATLALRWTMHWLRIVVLILAWLGWVAIVWIFPPATSYSYSDSIAVMGILALAVLILPLVIEQTVRLARRAPRAIPRLLGLGLAGGLLFLIPYLLWVYNVLPGIGWTTITAMVVTAATLAAGMFLWPRSREIAK